MNAQGLGEPAGYIKGHCVAVFPPARGGYTFVSISRRQSFVIGSNTVAVASVLQRPQKQGRQARVLLQCSCGCVIPVHSRNTQYLLQSRVRDYFPDSFQVFGQFHS